MEDPARVTFKCARGIRSRKWMMTIFIDNEVQGNMIINMLKTQLKYIEMYAGLEKCPTTDKLHIHCWIRTKTQVYAGPIAKTIKRGWINISQGDGTEARRYCLKGGNILVDEKKSELAYESDSNEKARFYLQKLKELNVDEFMEQYPGYWMSHQSTIMKTKEIMEIQNPKTWSGELQQKNFWLWGRPGTGKTKWAYSIDPQNTLPKNQNKWWNGFNSKITVVVIDDWSPSIKGMDNYLKCWGDRYSFTGEMKGGHLIIYPGRFLLVITSNYPPEDCFDRDEDIKAIERRFKIIQIKADDDLYLRTLPELSILDRE